MTGPAVGHVAWLDRTAASQHDIHTNRLRACLCVVCMFTLCLPEFLQDSAVFSHSPTCMFRSTEGRKLPTRSEYDSECVPWFKDKIDLSYTNERSLILSKIPIRSMCTFLEWQLIINSPLQGLCGWVCAIQRVVHFPGSTVTATGNTETTQQTTQIKRVRGNRGKGREGATFELNELSNQIWRWGKSSIRKIVSLFFFLPTRCQCLHCHTLICWYNLSALLPLWLTLQCHTIPWNTGTLTFQEAFLRN